MNKHIFFDNLTATVGALVAGKRKFFANSIQSISLEEHVQDIELDVPPIKGEGIFEIQASGSAKNLDPAFRVARWLGGKHPTIIFHHGNNERPFDFRKTAKNTFYNIFINTVDQIDANLIVVRAPYHNGTLRMYQDKMVDLNNFAGMIAASVKLNEAIIQQLKTDSEAPVVTAGISLGGWVTNLHRGLYNTSDAYVPLMAGTFLGELFIRSKYSKMASPKALNSPEVIRRVLNFDAVFKRQNSHNVFPLLARYDQFIQYEVQKESYNGFEIKTVDTGHVTGAMNSQLFRKHITEVLMKDIRCHVSV